MKMHKLFAFLIFATTLVATQLVNPTKTLAYPAVDTCDSTGCYLTVRTNAGDNSPGSLRNAINTACTSAGDDLIDFSRYSVDRPVIALAQPLVIPTDCRGGVQIAGRSDFEVIINAPLARSTPAVLEPATSGQNQCAMYVNSNNNVIHHLTFTGAPFAVCVYGQGNKVSDNHIGVKRDGSAGANQVGLYVTGAGNQVLNNEIAGNTSHGIVLKGNRSLIQQNYIGVTHALGLSNSTRGNGGSGIRLITGAALNLIGGDLILNANFVRYNGAGGVVLENGAGLSNKISHNRFAGNSGLAIDLNADSVSLPNPSDAGPNNMIDMPYDIQTIPASRDGVFDSYFFRGRAPENYTIEVYLTDPIDSTDPLQVLTAQSYGEGDYLLASQTVNATRDGKFTVTLNSSLLGIGKKVSAILIDGSGNTSEFSAAVELTDHPNPRSEGCGDGAISATETCDDGNTDPGDGCSAICSVETGFRCTGTPSRCDVEVVTCGDGQVDGTEVCDDGNRAADDGCAGDCTQEPGWTCTRNPGQRSVCTMNPTDGPNTPTNLTADPVGPRNIRVSFDDPSSDETGFVVQRADGACASGRSAADFTGFFFLPAQAGVGRVNWNDLSVEPNRTYCYRAFTMHGSTASSPSNQDDATTPREGSVTGLDEPSNLRADPESPTRVRVTFTDNSTTETGFEVDRADGPCSATNVFTRLATLAPAAGIGSTITYYDDTAQPAHTYCYRARAINPDGTSTYSNTDDATTPALSTTCGNGRTDAGESCDDTNARAGDGCSNACQVETGWSCTGTPSVCTQNNPNGPPTGLTATPTGPETVRVVFTDNSDNETGFGIDRADGECSAQSVFTQIGVAPAMPGTGGTVIVIDNTVEPGKTYCYRARGITPTGSTEPSNSDSATTPDLAITPPPGGGLNLEIEGSGCALQTGLVSRMDLSGLILWMSGAAALFIARRKKA